MSRIFWLKIFKQSVEIPNFSVRFEVGSKLDTANIPRFRSGDPSSSVNKLNRFPLIELDKGEADRIGEEDRKDSELSLKLDRKLGGEPIGIGSDEGGIELTAEVEIGPEASFEISVALGKLPVIYWRPHTTEKILIRRRANPGVNVEIN